MADIVAASFYGKLLYGHVNIRKAVHVSVMNGLNMLLRGGQWSVLIREIIKSGPACSSNYVRTGYF
jgi:hypothetical protein